MDEAMCNEDRTKYSFAAPVFYRTVELNQWIKIVLAMAALVGIWFSAAWLRSFASTSTVKR